MPEGTDPAGGEPPETVPGPAGSVEGPAVEPRTPPRRSLRERSARLRERAEAAKRSAATRAEDLQARSSSARLAFAAYERDRRHAGGLLAGGLAFRLFLWLLPAALVVVSVLRLASTASSTPPEEIARSAGLGAALRATVAQAVEASGGSAAWLLVLGIVLMLWAGVSLVKALRLLAGVAWQVRPGPLKHSVRAAAICSVVALALSGFPVLLGPLYAGGIVSDLIASLLTVAAITAVVAWILSVLPHAEGVSWLGLLPGALLIGVGTEILRLVTAVYFAPRLGRTADLYGALGVAAVFLAWLYLIGRLVVAGMNLNAELWRSQHAQADGGSERPPPSTA